MKKLKLDLNDLKVESFETNPKLVKHQGTVKGYNTNTNPSCAGEACPQSVDFSCQPTYCGSCAATCDATCPNTCVNTCDNSTCAGATCPECGVTEQYTNCTV